MNKDRVQENVHEKPYEVTYLVLKTGKRIRRDFDSPYLARRFAKRVEMGNKCAVISKP